MPSRLFLKTKLEIRSMGKVFFFPIFILWIVFPAAAWFSLQTNFDVGMAYKQVASLVEGIVPLLSVIWPVSALQMYFSDDTREILKVLHGPKVTALHTVVKYAVLHSLAVAVMYLILTLLFSQPEVLFYECIRTLGQCLFMAGLSYAAACIFHSHLVGLLGAIVYVLVLFYMYNGQGNLFSIFLFDRLLWEEPQLIGRVVQIWILGGGLLAVGYVENRFYLKEV